jgi:hypothetical protein
MNRDESIALYDEKERDPSKRREKWNAWARERLAEKKRLQESGEWEDVKKQEEWKRQSSVNFSNHPFKFHADFHDFLFPAYACFDGALFENGADFSNAVMNEGADFIAVTFGGDSHFKNTRFKAPATFSKTTFERMANFSEAKFCELVKFTDTTFSGWADFSKAIFSKEADFGVRVFSKKSKFDDAIFKERVDFKRAHFGTSNPNLAEEEEAGEVSFFQTEFKKSADFKGAQFYVKKADFRAIQAERFFSLNSVKFHHCVPDFVQAHFQEAPLLEHFKIPLKRPTNIDKIAKEVLKKEKSELPPRYRALKRLALQGNDHEREQDFFAAELLSLRGVEDFPRGKGAERYWGGKFYQWLSDFGRSAFIPLRLWLITIALSFSIYAFDHWLNLTVNIWGWFIVALIVGIWGMIMVYFVPVKRMRMMLVLLASTLFLLLPLWATASCVSGSKDNSALTEAMLLSLKNAFVALPINMNERTNQLYACLYGVEKSPLSGTVSTPIIPDGVATLGIVQTLFSAVVIFLFLLAVRAKFRIK